MFITVMSVILHYTLCAAQDYHGRQTRMCGSGSNQALCNWSDYLAEQTWESFSFNQCVGLNYDFSGFFVQVCSFNHSLILSIHISTGSHHHSLQDNYIHFAMRLPNPVLFSRNRVCALHNVTSTIGALCSLKRESSQVCMSGTGEIGSPLRVSFYSPPDLRPFLPNASLPLFKSGEMVAGGFRVHVEFEPVPSDPAVFYDGTTFFQTPGDWKTSTFTL
jgi:hypothetical protein